MTNLRCASISCSKLIENTEEEDEAVFMTASFFSQELPSSFTLCKKCFLKIGAEYRINMQIDDFVERMKASYKEEKNEIKNKTN